MAQDNFTKPNRDAEGLTQGEAIASVLAVGWMVVLGVFFWLTKEEGIDRSFSQIVLILIAIFVPAGLIWLSALLARTARHLREDLHLTQAQVKQLTRALAQGEHSAQPKEPKPRDGTKLADPPRQTPEPAVDEPPLARADFLRAIHFPDDESDAAGFAALRRALRDTLAKQLINASQDILTMLSHNGIYMDDLVPDPTDPSQWRALAHGKRGGEIAGLAAIRIEALTDLIKDRAREDEVFRDATHHFMRSFDKMMPRFEHGATDQEIASLADTRTGRAYMLLGYALGAFS